MKDNENINNPRVVIIQKLYSHFLNQETKISFSKHRYKKFIKDVVNGTIERKELIEEHINKELGQDINHNRTELILKLLIMAAIYEFMFMHRIPVKVIIAEYLKVTDFFIEIPQKNFLNAILDKVAKVTRVSIK